MPTEEVGVSYVSSIVKPPPLDIRDEINFVSPVASGMVLRRWAYGVMGTSSLLVVFVLLRFFKRSKASESQELEHESGAETSEEDVVGNREPILSPKQARRKFLRELHKLRAESRLDLMKKIRSHVRSLLLAELQGTIRNSMSENEIYAKLSGLDVKQVKQIGSKYVAMLDLARRLKGYQEDIDLEKYSSDSVNWREVIELSKAVSGLKLRKSKMAWSFIKRLVSKSRRRLDMAIKWLVRKGS